MGLFGDQDANDVSDNPFFVEDGKYLSLLNEFVLRESQKNEGVRGLSFNWTIEDEAAEEYDGSRISEWINVYLSDDDAPDTASLRRDRARLKSRLVQIGMSADEMNELIDADGVFNEDIAKNYVGINAFVSVKNTKDKNFDENGKSYTNITSVEIP